MALSAPVAGFPRLRPIATFPAIGEPAAPEVLSSADIESYARCPRRFFYARVLGLSSRTRAGAYLDAHGCLQEVLAYVRDLGGGEAYDAVRARAIFDTAWDRSGLNRHPFGSAYRTLTLGMLDRLHGAAVGDRLGDGTLTTVIGGETIGVRIDRTEIDGPTRVVKTIRSGRLSKSDPDRLSATLTLKAVREAYGPQVRVQNHYLQDGGVAVIDQTAAKYAKRVGDCTEAVGEIRAGHYAPLRSDFSCPRCPFLFVCAVPGEPATA